MAFKLTMIMQLQTQPYTAGPIARIGGWTESVYSNTLTTADRTSFRNLMIARAGCLPSNATIVGQRYQVVNPTGGSSTGGEIFPGTVTASGESAGDVPQMALYCRTYTNAANIRSTILRGIPDAWVVGGELRKSVAETALTAYFAQLTGWLMYGRNLAAVAYPLAGVGATGIASLFANQAFTTPGRIRISSSVDANGLRRGGSFKALSQPTASSVQLEGWTYGVTTGGQIRDQAPQLYTMTNTVISRIIVKKVGRPLFVYRGRRSKRRR